MSDSEDSDQNLHLKIQTRKKLRNTIKTFIRTVNSEEIKEAKNYIRQPRLPENQLAITNGLLVTSTEEWSLLSYEYEIVDGLSSINQYFKRKFIANMEVAESEHSGIQEDIHNNIQRGLGQTSPSNTRNSENKIDDCDNDRPDEGSRRSPRQKTNTDNNTYADIVDDCIEEYLQQTCENEINRTTATNRDGDTTPNRETNDKELDQPNSTPGENIQITIEGPQGSDGENIPKEGRRTSTTPNSRFDLPNILDESEVELHPTEHARWTERFSRIKRQREENSDGGNSSTNEETSDRDEMDNAETTERELQTTTISESEESDDENNTESRCLYSFIVHQTPGGGRPPKRARGGSTNFCKFDHGDHFHIIFTTQPNNKKRSFERICNYLNLTLRELTNARITLIGIFKEMERFVYYLLRKGLKTYQKFNKGIDLNKGLANSLHHLLNQNIDVTDTSPEEACIQFMEKKRDLRRDNRNNSGPSNYKIQYDEFIDLIKEHNIKDINELLDKIEEEKFAEYYARWGKSWQQNVQSIISFQNKINNKTLMKTPFNKLLKKEKAGKPQRPEAIKWIYTLFEKQGVNLIKWLAEFLLIRNKALHKKNCMVIHGPPNTGKTMIMRLMTHCLNPTYIDKAGEASNFYFSKLIGASVALMEEPNINIFNINTWKILLAGETHTTEIKNGPHQIINRVPFFLTTNEEEFGISVGIIDRSALKTRTFIHNFSQQIINNMDITQGIPMPPYEIEPADMAWVFLLNEEKIMNHYSLLLDTLPAGHQHGDAQPISAKHSSQEGAKIK